MGSRRSPGRPGSLVPPPQGGSMARARPVLWMPGLGAGRRRQPGSRGGAFRQLWSCFLRPPPHSLSRGRLPKPRVSALGRALAYSPPAGRERPWSGLVATCRGLRPLPLRAKLCRLSAPRAGRVLLHSSSASSQRSATGKRGRGRGGSARRPGPCPGGTPARPGVGVAGAGDEPGPTPANQRTGHTHLLALTPFPALPDLSDGPLTCSFSFHI
nr:translation initiation factor IF-2-like [Pan troglodytes]XP_054521898.1 translation initiation factor IF-2-like [Pan troglodytes]